MKSSSDVQPRFFAFFAMHYISEIKDDFQVVSQFPCLLGHPVYGSNLDLLSFLSQYCKNFRSILKSKEDSV